MSKKKILVFIDWFEPAFKAGGPIRSCVNFVNNMSRSYDVFVFTSDRDLDDRQPLAEILTDQWINHASGAKLFYASSKYLNWKNIFSIIENIAPDFIYLNGLFSRYFTIYPLLIKRINKIQAKIILAPRGMLKKSALRFKFFKKKIFLKVFIAIQLHKFVVFHATSESEADEITEFLPNSSSIAYVPNFPGSRKEFSLPPEKSIGKLKIIFVGRIHPIKNLHLLLKILYLVGSHIHLTIVGVVEDSDYWNTCKYLIKGLRPNIIIDYVGEVNHLQLDNLLKANHLFCLPTSGENFGHAIFEALSVGRPVLISDQTPWRGLENIKVGWDIPLKNMDFYSHIIEYVAGMDDNELKIWSESAWKYCDNYINDLDIKRKYLNLFQ